MPDTERTERPSYPAGNKRDIIARMLRVNHAGEYGATRIYAGQLRVLKNDPCAEEIKHMGEQEDVHLAYFNKILPERGVRSVTPPQLFGFVIPTSRVMSLARMWLRSLSSRRSRG